MKLKTALAARAGLYRRIRQYFDETGVMEVMTPVLSFAGNTDPAIESFQSTYIRGHQRRPMYLHTSPEFFMKRLLCQGSGSIYQLCPVFRLEEQGCQHNPEFAMLEWYRLNFDYRQLMQDVAALISSVTGMSPVVSEVSYRQLFEPWQIDPHTASADQLAALAGRQGIDLYNSDDFSIDQWLDLLMTHVVEPAMDPQQMLFVYDFPQSQASLAKCRHEDVSVAERFELYWGGMELANGFSELTDAAEQRKRFEQDNLKRQRLGLQPVAVDEHFLAALEQGMPACSGVAMGIDRLLMIMLQAANIDEVLTFGIDQV